MKVADEEHEVLRFEFELEDGSRAWVEEWRDSYQSHFWVVFENGERYEGFGTGMYLVGTDVSKLDDTIYVLNELMLFGRVTTLHAFDLETRVWSFIGRADVLFDEK